MAGQTVQITLTAKDGTSQVFRTVGKEAQAMGKQVDQAGTTGERSLSKLSKAGAVTGAAFTALSGTLSLASRANAEAEASQARLETAIDNTGHSMFEYEDALNAASKAALQLGFDDEDAADSIAALTTVTGDAERAISDLAIAEDIARARNISLEAATKLVIAAENERFGALARVGIKIDEGMTKEQALDALRSKFAGNAEAYAETSAAGYDRIRNSAENALEAIGAHLGPTQELLMILPGLSAGFTGVGAAVGAIAPGLTATAAASGLLTIALGPVGIVAAAIAAAGAILYFGNSLDDQFVPDTEAAISALAALNTEVENFVAASSPLTPLAQDVAGSLTYITGASTDYQEELVKLQEAQDEASEAAKNAKQAFGEESESYSALNLQAQQAAAALATYERQEGKNYVAGQKLAEANEAALDILRQTGKAGTMVRAELALLYADQQSGALGWEEYVDKIIALDATIPEIVRGLTETGYAVDETTTATEDGVVAYNKYFDAAARALTVSSDEMAALREQAAAQDELNQKKADYAAFAGMQVQTGDLTSLIAQNAALKEQQGAYYGVRDGITSVNEAQAVFKQTQDGILASQEPFNQQLSEYNGQLSNLEAAEDLLNERRAAGIPITAAQEDFLTRVDAAQARLQGGTEDATLALGEQALQYAENMRIGDELNRNMGDTADATSALDQTIQDLIIALQGIPGYVKATIDVESDDAQARADFIKRQLDALNGYYANATISVGLVGPGVGFTMGSQQHGGMIPHAQHGAALHGWSWVGEAGPELIHAPGATVLPHTASVATTRGNGGGGISINGPITVYANDPRSFMDQMRSYTYAGARA